MLLHQFAVSGFAYKLTPLQREALLSILVNMAAVDQDVSVEEEGFLVAWANEWQLPLDLTPEETPDDQQLLSVFTDFSSKIIVLQEIVKLSYQDGHFGDEERERTQQIALRLGIHDMNTISNINRWVRNWFDWLYMGEQMLESENWLNNAC